MMIMDCKELIKLLLSRKKKNLVCNVKFKEMLKIRDCVFSNNKCWLYKFKNRHYDYALTVPTRSEKNMTFLIKVV